MELQYIFIQEYNNFIIEQGFNFSGKFNFRYNKPTEGNIPVRLFITKNPNYINNFYSLESETDNTKISNITAIVGENGSGKSTLLDFIKEHLSRGKFKSNVIIAFYDQSILKIYKPENMELEIHSKDIDYNIIPIKIGSKFKPTPLEGLENTNFIFFSNIFDLKMREIQHSKLLNISTNYLLETAVKQSGYLNQNEISVHRFREMDRQLKMINEEKNELLKIPFSLPKYVKVSFLNTDLENQEDFTSEILDMMDEFQKDRDKQKTRNRLEIFELNILLCLIYHYLIEMHYQNSGFDVYKLFMDHYLNQKGTFKEKVTTLLDKASEKFQNSEVNKINLAKNLVSFFEFIIENGMNNVINVKRMTFEFSVNDNALFKELNSLYIDTIDVHEYLSYGWRDLSSGEKALLNIYSRFYSVKKQIIEDNIIVLIDEGEIYLHPEWQRRLVYNLIQFLTSLFKNKNIQIIITSNSPFIISDLPSSSIIFLKRTEDSSKIISGLEEQHHTFAANIHNLLSHSFFMGDGLIGDFAKYKINKIIDLLMNSKAAEIYRYKEDIEKTINIIGEPIIKNKLLSILNEKMSVNMMNIDEKIGMLEKQIDELRKSK
ncbi:AAA family ATPase [Bacillus sp. EB01]|uniref:AAA family ATPase n=1 Tax=Bacillus sp. EB01 TaxID=1347086 RepID=UPI000694DBE3|nr:AAA family ATPase [Bacillus sp. EB01]